jgi:hypothetical protein
LVHCGIFHGLSALPERVLGDWGKFKRANPLRIKARAAAELRDKSNDLTACGRATCAEVIERIGGLSPTLLGPHRACARNDVRDAKRDLQPDYYSEENEIGRRKYDAANDGRVFRYATKTSSGWDVCLNNHIYSCSRQPRQAPGALSPPSLRTLE